jgi:hypothetical protein
MVTVGVLLTLSMGLIVLTDIVQSCVCSPVEDSRIVFSLDGQSSLKVIPNGIKDTA